jgi:hypothetical protein
MNPAVPLMSISFVFHGPSVQIPEFHAFFPGLSEVPLETWVATSISAVFSSSCGSASEPGTRNVQILKRPGSRIVECGEAFVVDECFGEALDQR